MNAGPFCILVLGGLLVIPFHPRHLPDDENMKAWYWISHGNSNPNEWSHLWAMRKFIKTMEYTIIDSGDVGKMPMSLEREKLVLKWWKRKKNADSNSSKLMKLYKNIKFCFMNVQILN